MMLLHEVHFFASLFFMGCYTGGQRDDRVCFIDNDVLGRNSAWTCGYTDVLLSSSGLGFATQNTGIDTFTLSERQLSFTFYYYCL